MKNCLVSLREMNLSLKERFDNERIIFALPMPTLYIKQDSDWRLGSEALSPRIT